VVQFSHTKYMDLAKKSSENQEIIALIMQKTLPAYPVH
jgi:hypothetical protein